MRRVCPFGERAQAFFSDRRPDSGSVKNLSEELTLFAQRRHKKLMTYVCNKAWQVKKALDLNADVIMTDHPGWLTGYLAAERKVLYSLSHRGRGRVGANNIRWLSFPPPSPPNGR